MHLAGITPPLNSRTMSHFISLTEAKTMTTRYKNDREGILKQEYQQRNILILSETFDRAAFDTLLAKPGCAGLRFYYGMMPDLQVRLIAVAIDQDGHDIITPREDELDENTVYDDIVEKGVPCPPECPLNPAL
jgi:hypothetical protein